MTRPTVVTRAKHRSNYGRCPARSSTRNGAGLVWLAARLPAINGRSTVRALTKAGFGGHALARQHTRNSFRRFGHRHEQSERAARKWCESKVAIEGRCLFICRLDHDGENRERTGGANYPTNRVGEQEIADPFAANSLITRETPNESSWNELVAWQMFCMFGRQVGNGECEGTQAVETDDPTLIVDGDKNTRHITILVLSSAKVEPVVERSHPARKFRAVMLTERFDRFDHPRSAEEMAVTLQGLDKTRGRSGVWRIAARKASRSAPDKTIR